ncbi:MAG: tetratricopeptide repeat protein [Verrucomicrobiales bacterium]
MFAIRKVMQRYFALILGIILISLGSACSPSGPKALLQGEQLIKKGDYNGAVRKLEIASQKLPNYPQVWNFLGLAYHGQGKHNEALASYQKALNIDRNFSVAYYNLGSLLFEMNKLPDALSALTSYTILNPNTEDAWLKIAAIQLRMQKPEDAERATAQALKINPNNPEAYNNLGLVAVQRRKTRDALQLFDKALHYQEDYAPAILNQAVILQTMPANKALALQRYKAYLSLQPNSKEAPTVRQSITVLEAELNPPPPVAIRTNPPVAVAAQTNLPPPQATNPPVQIANRSAATNQPAIAPDSASSRAPVATNVALTPVPKTPTPVASATNTLPGSNKALTSGSASTSLIEPQPQTTRPIRTNQLAGNTPTSAPATNRAAPASPVETKIAEVTPPTKLETVPIQDDATLKPVQDIQHESPLSPPTTQMPAPSTASTNVASVERQQQEPDINISRIGSSQSDNKNGVLQKINPTSWFRGNRNNSQGDAQPSIASSQIPRPAANPAPMMRPAPPVEEKPKVVARYPFKRQMHLPEGDRAAAEISYNKAVTAHQEKRIASAIESYMEAIKLNPAYFQAYYNLSLAAYQIRDLPLAMSAGEAAVFLKPGSVDSRYNFALALRDANYHFDAANQLRELLVESPDDIRAHFTLANIYAQQLNLPQLAQRHYMKVLQLDPRHPQAAQIRYWISRVE